MQHDCSYYSSPSGTYRTDVLYPFSLLDVYLCWGLDDEVIIQTRLQTTKCSGTLIRKCTQRKSYHTKLCTGPTTAEHRSEKSICFQLAGRWRRTIKFIFRTTVSTCWLGTWSDGLTHPCTENDTSVANTVQPRVGLCVIITHLLPNQLPSASWNHFTWLSRKKLRPRLLSGLHVCGDGWCCTVASAHWSLWQCKAFCGSNSCLWY